MENNYLYFVIAKRNGQVQAVYGIERESDNSIHGTILFSPKSPRFVGNSVALKKAQLTEHIVAGTHEVTHDNPLKVLP